MRPPFSFWSCQKENGPRPVQEKKTPRRVGPRRARTSGRRRWMVGLTSWQPSSNAFPLGMLFARGGPGCPVFLFPLALPWQFARLSSSTRQRASEFRRIDLSTTTPNFHQTGNRGARPAQGSEPARAGRRLPQFRQHIFRTTPVFKQTCAHAQVLRPAFFSFGPGAARFLFGKIEKKMGGALPRPMPHCRQQLGMFPGRPQVASTPPPRGAYCRGQRRQKEQTYGFL